MSTHEDTIKRANRSRSFVIVLNKLKKAYKKKPAKWLIGAALHIQCQRESKGRWEYFDSNPKGANRLLFAKCRYEIKLIDMVLDKAAVATIRESTIADKYARYEKYKYARYEKYHENNT